MKPVKGTVLDEANLPLPGASVIVQGTQRGVITDAKGLYENGDPRMDSKSKKEAIEKVLNVDFSEV